MNRMMPEQWAQFDRWPKACVIDPHPRKASFIIWAAIDPNDRHIIMEEWPITSYYETPGPQWGVKEYADKIKAIEAGDNQIEHPIENVLWRIMDPNFGRTLSASSGRCLQDEFEDYGISWDTQVNDKIDQGHIAVQGMLQDPPQLLVTPNCTNVIKAFERYVYDEYTRNADETRQKETPRDEYKDAMDVVRYLVMSRLRYVDISQRPKTYYPKDMGL